MSKAKNERQRVKGLVTSLKSERTSFEPHWKELSKYISPSSLRLEDEKSKNGDKQYGEIIDSTATLSVRTLSSGIMAGLTRPSNPWFALALKDTSIQETKEIKQYLFSSTQVMLDVMAGSNIYGILQKIYADTGVYSTAACLIEEDEKDIIRGTHFPVGEFWIAQDFRGRVNTFYREFYLTVEQIVDQFGKNVATGEIDWSKISDKVKKLWDEDKDLNKIKVGHLIRPNKNFDKDKLEPQFKRFSSLYFEVSNGESEDLFLRKSGYDYFPVLAPRWSTYGNDIYGTDSPGMLVLGDVKQLQFGEEKKLQAIEKKIDPPMVGPTNLQNQKLGIGSGDVVFEDPRGNGRGFRAAHEVNISISELSTSQNEVRNRIKQGMHESAFKMISDLSKSNATAREIAELKEEKLLEVGPVFERFQPDLLAPFIEIVYFICLRRNLLPKTPKDLGGKSPVVEYRSILDQARRAVTVSTVEAFFKFAVAIMQVAPETKDKINFDEILDVIANDMGVSPTLLTGDDELTTVRDAKKKAAEEQAKLTAKVQELSLVGAANRIQQQASQPEGGV